MLKHPDYNEMLEEWEKARKFYHSEKFVHDSTITYLPMLDDMTDEEYAGYLQRAALFMLFKHAVDIYTGLVTRKKPLFTDADSLDDWFKTADVDGASGYKYMHNILLEFFKTGRCGTLVDLPEGPTHADPSLLLYNAESIINWRTQLINGKRELIMVMLEEETLTNPNDILDQETETVYRQLVLVDGKYVQQIFGADETLKDTIEPKINGKRLDYIPFVIHGGINVCPVFLGEVLDLNVHHYRVSADDGHGTHFAALPTKTATGVDFESAPNNTGPTRMMVSENENARFGILEFTGQGLGPVRERMDRFERVINHLTASFVSTQNNKTATQSNIEFTGSTASLAATVSVLSSEFTRVLEIAAEWMKKEFGSIELSTDFVSARLSAQDLTALTAAVMQGEISYETYWRNLQQGEIADPHRTHEEEQAMIEESEPVGMIEQG